MWNYVRRNCLTGGRVFATTDGFGEAYELIDHQGFALYLGGEFMGIIADIGSAP